MEFDDSTFYIKQELPEDNEKQVELLEPQVYIIKSEKGSIEQFQSTSLNTLDPEVISNCSLEPKLETLAEDCVIENVFIKEELLYEELNIKSDNETIQQPTLGNNSNLGNQLQNHITVLSSIKRFKCDICDKDFGYKHILRSHLKTHTGEKPYKCNVCHKDFGEKCNLQEHLRTHTGEKPFICNICEDSYAQQGSLKRHLRTHTGVKPFKCSICDKKFRDRSTMKNHLRTHTGEKPFKCNICDKDFRQKSTLQNHLRTHTGD